MTGCGVMAAWLYERRRMDRPDGFLIHWLYWIGVDLRWPFGRMPVSVPGRWARIWRGRRGTVRVPDRFHVSPSADPVGTPCGRDAAFFEHVFHRGAYRFGPLATSETRRKPLS